MPPAPPEFLVVDGHNDNRFLLTKTLLRKFPNALIQECQDRDPALLVAARPSLTAAILHRARDLDGLGLIAAVRAVNQAVQILYVSGANHRSEAFKAGANGFLLYDAWLRVGTVVEDMLKTNTPSPFAAPGELDDTPRAGR